jgi:hypothetical protein
MKFLVKTSKEDVEISRHKLCDLLINKVLTGTKKEFPALSTALTDFLQGSNTLSSITLDELVTTSLGLGYYYRVFLEKNTVEIIGDTSEETTDKINDEPSSTEVGI